MSEEILRPSDLRLGVRYGATHIVARARGWQMEMRRETGRGSSAKAAYRVYLYEPSDKVPGRCVAHWPVSKVDLHNARIRFDRLLDKRPPY